MHTVAINGYVLFVLLDLRTERQHLFRLRPAARIRRERDAHHRVARREALQALLGPSLGAARALLRGTQDRLHGAASPVNYLSLEANVGGRCGAMQQASGAPPAALEPRVSGIHVDALYIHEKT